MLATITFKAISNGSSPLKFNFTLNESTDTNVAGAGKDLLVSVGEGRYTVGGGEYIDTIVITQKAKITKGVLSGRFVIGTTSNRIKLLQKMLSSDKSIYPEGITSVFYGRLTVKSVERFQEKYGIVSSGTPKTTGYGMVGPKTMKKIN